jgi:alpha-methylacyl-CoA racemase
MGPLEGVKVIELAGIGPGPFCAMMLADLGAAVIQVDRVSSVPEEIPDERPLEPLSRGRKSIGIDLKNQRGIDTLLTLIDGADALVEGFRPGVMERLGVGPDVCLDRNPKLIYGRMTGWGQTGPLASTAGHDINYIGLSGVLSLMRRAGEAPLPPVNLVGDFGGGGMLLAIGICAALFEAERSGKGQVIDAAMTDGSALLATLVLGYKALGERLEDPMRSMRAWLEPGTNFIDTGAPFYDVYECADGEFVTIGAIEPQFYAELSRLTGLDGEDFPAQNDRAQWPAMKVRVAKLFKTKARDEWVDLFGEADACFAPVLSVDEAAKHPHNVARATYVEIEGVVQPAPAPRFSRTVAEISGPPPHPGEQTADVLAASGFSSAEISALRDDGAVR